MAGIKFTVAGADAARAFAVSLPEKARKQTIGKLSQVAYDHVQAEADTHTVTGALFRSVVNRPYGSTGREVGHDEKMAPHAPFVVFGTRAHEIVPKLGGSRTFLRFIGRHGDFVFRRRVWHPGYAGDDYITTGAVAALDALRRIIDEIDFSK